LAASHPQAFDKLRRGAALEAATRRNTQAPKVPKVQFSFKVVDARIDACHRSLTRQRRVSIGTQRCWVAFPRASNVELPVPIPASTPTNKLLQLGNFCSL